MAKGRVNLRCEKCGKEAKHFKSYKYPTNAKMITSIEEIEAYFNAETTCYDFSENGELMDIEINFDLKMSFASHIRARHIIAKDIDVMKITAKNIYADDIRAYELTAHDINASNIIAHKLKANNIKFYAVCYAYDSFECKSIVGTRPNSRYFCLDSDVKVG